jgi:hypothetical protein
MAHDAGGDNGAIPYDLGTPADPGNNHFETTIYNAIFMRGSASTVNASGNTWVPNEQGADGAGHYAVGTVLSGVNGRNVTCPATSSVTM